MPIIIDFSQVALASINQSLNKIPDINEDIIRHMIYNSLRRYKMKFKKTYGEEMILAIDGSNNWRKKIFPLYKWKRQQAKKNSDTDWPAIYSAINNIVQNLKEHSHYKVIHVDECEADDVIGWVAKYTAMMKKEKVMVVSGDKDFRQLQQYKGVKQYSPVLKVMINDPDPKGYLKELIIRGDPDDGVPNILSVENSFKDSIRQKAVMQKKLDVWLTQKPEMFCDDFSLERWKMNQELIDLSFTPKDVCDKIQAQYNKEPLGTKGTFFSHMMMEQMIYLMYRINEF